jgi:hypothetical protein
MSGFEITGVVLGSVPLLVSALQLYIEGASTLKRWRFHSRELKSLVRVLETEHAKLQNVCEKLLMGMVPEAQIEAMINDPLGEAWQSREVYAKIRIRLWRSFTVFEDGLRDMHDAMEELKSKLGMGPDGKVCGSKLDLDGKARFRPTSNDQQIVRDESSIKRALKGGALVLQRSEYNTLTDRLRDGISSLESLINMNVDMEPDRRKRSRGRLHNLVRALAGGVYRALQSSLTCECPGLHDVGLRMMDQPITVTPHDTDEDVMCMLKLGLVVSFASTALDTGGQLRGSTRRWNRLHIQPTQHPQSPAPTAPVASNRKSVGFAVSTKTLVIRTYSDTSQDLGRVGSLCQVLRKAPKLSADVCCGHIADESRCPSPEYGVYTSADADAGSDWALVSLRDALTAGTGPSPPLLYGDRLRLAWLITSGVLQLQGTPWLPGNLTHDEIFLVKKDGVVLYREVFVQRRFPETGPQLVIHQGATGVTSLALGMLLIEVILGQPLFEKVHPDTSMIAASDPWRHLVSYEAASQLLGKVNTHGGPNYCSAVNMCIRGGSQLESSSSTDVFSKVLGLLEMDLEMTVA